MHAFDRHLRGTVRLFDLAEAARGGIGGEKRGVPSPHAPTLDYCCNVEARAAPC